MLALSNSSKSAAGPRRLVELCQRDFGAVDTATMEWRVKPIAQFAGLVGSLEYNAQD